MKQVVRFTLAQHVFFNLLFVLLMVAGAYSLLDMPVERYPQINFGKVIITTYYPGATASEVEALITTKIEEAIENLEDVEFFSSTSYQERSDIVVKFVDDTDYDALYDELRFEVISIQKDLPADADPPRFTMISTSEWLPVVAVNLAGDRSNRALTLMAEDLKIPLSRVEGVEEVKLQGEYTREFHVVLDPERMTRLGVTFDQAAQALGAANISIPAGDYTDESGEFTVRVDERFRSREDVARVIVRRDLDGSFVRMEDIIAFAEMAYRDPVVITSVNGRDSVTLSIVKTDAGNALDIKTGVMEIIDQYRPLLAEEGVEIVVTQDSTVYIDDAMNTLGWNLIVGVILVTIIIWYFMGVRNAGLTTVGIPFSFLVTMILMYLTGNSLNEITLFSFVLVSGIIVDDAIVVVENIYRHVQMGRPLKDALVDGTSEVFFPVISATTTTVAAFLPMLIMTGSTGEFFALVPKAVTFAIAASLIECLFILPLHYKDWGPKPDTGKDSLHERENILLKLARVVTNRVTRFTLRFRFLSLGMVLLAFLVSMVVFGLSVSGVAPLIKIKFFPDDYNLYYVIVEGPPSTTIQAMDAKLKEISDFVLADGPAMAEAATGNAGYYLNEDYAPVMGSNYGQVVVTLPAKKDQEFTDAPGNDIIRHLENMRERVTQAFQGDGWIIRVRAELGGPPAGKDITVRAVGTDADAVAALARETMDHMRNNPAIAGNLVDLDDDQGQPGRVIRFHVRPERAAEYGLTPAAVAALAASVLDGRFSGDFRLADEDVDIKLMIDPNFFTTPERALDIPLIEHVSGPIRLGDLCAMETLEQPGEIQRFNGDRAVTLEANLRSDSTTSTPAMVNLVRKHYDEVREDFPGAALEFAGEYESTRRSYTSLGYAFLIALLVMYLILANQFKSYLQPLIILSAVIFSLIGVILGKLVTQTLFTINSFVAVVGVTGVVVNDSLVLVDFINRMYRQGMPRREALQEGIRVRLRPILLTTLTTTLGLLPMAVGFPEYSLVWGTMASTFVTGLCTATMLTLFIVPVQWDLLTAFAERRERRRKRRKERRAKRRAERAAASSQA